MVSYLVKRYTSSYSNYIWSMVSPWPPMLSCGFGWTCRGPLIGSSLTSACLFPRHKRYSVVTWHVVYQGSSDRKIIKFAPWMRVSASKIVAFDDVSYLAYTRFPSRSVEECSRRIMMSSTNRTHHHDALWQWPRPLVGTWTAKTVERERKYGGRPIKRAFHENGEQLLCCRLSIGKVRALAFSDFGVLTRRYVLVSGTNAWLPVQSTYSYCPYLLIGMLKLEKASGLTFFNSRRTACNTATVRYFREWLVLLVYLHIFVLALQCRSHQRAWSLS